MTSIRNERGGSLQTIKGQQAQWQNLPAISGDVRDAGSIPGWGRSPGEGIGHTLPYSGASLVAQMVKNLLSLGETWVQSLGWEDPLEKGMVTHTSILAWRIPWTEEPGWPQAMGLQRVGHN